MIKRQVKNDGVTVDISFQVGQIHFEVTNGECKSHTTDLHEALGEAKVVRGKTNF